MAREPSASILLLKLVVGAAERAGVPPAEILRAAQVAAAVLEDPEARVPYAAIQRAWDAALRGTGDEAFALRVAQAAAPGAFRVLDYLGRSSATLREALRQVERYYRLIHDTVTVRLVEEGDEARVVYGGLPDQVPGQAAELALALILLRSREFIGTAWTPRWVSFRHPAPRDPAPWRDLFGPPVRFEAPENALAFDAALLSAAVVTADPTLRAILDRHAEESLARLPKVDDFVQEVRARIAAALGGGEPSLEEVAGALGVTGRTLQRRLKEQGASYQALLDEVRRELSTRYLRERHLDISEVAFLLGFSEPSAFHRAFKRWTGKTPAAWRG